MPGARRPAVPGVGTEPRCVGLGRSLVPAGVGGMLRWDAPAGGGDPGDPFPRWGGRFQSRWLRGALQGIKAQWGEPEPGHPQAPASPTGAAVPSSTRQPPGPTGGSHGAVPSSAPAPPQGQDASCGEGVPEWGWEAVQEQGLRRQPWAPTPGCPSWCWGAETPLPSLQAAHPPPGQGSPARAAGPPGPCPCRRVMLAVPATSHCPGAGLVARRGGDFSHSEDRSHPPPGCWRDSARGCCSAGPSRGSASTSPSLGLVPPAAAPGGCPPRVWAEQSSCLPACPCPGMPSPAKSCRRRRRPAKVSR